MPFILAVHFLFARDLLEVHCVQFGEHIKQPHYVTSREIKLSIYLALYVQF